MFMLSIHNVDKQSLIATYCSINAMIK